MICKNCGSQLSDGAKFCGMCGAHVYESQSGDSTVLLNRTPAANSGDSTVLLNRTPAANNDDSTVLLNSASAEVKPDDRTALLNSVPVETQPGKSAVVFESHTQAAAQNAGRSRNKPKKSRRKKSVFPVIAVITLVIVICLGSAAYYMKNRETLEDILIKAEQNFNNADYAAALADYDRLLAKDPINVSAYKGKAQIYIKQELFDEAEDVVRTGFSKTNDSALWEMYQELIFRNIGE